MLFPVKTFFGAINSTQTAGLAFDRIESVWKLKDRTQRDRGKVQEDTEITVNEDTETVEDGVVVWRAAGFRMRDVFPALRKIVDARGHTVPSEAVVFSTGLHFEIPPGEHWGVYGRVGCGKSSLIRTLLGEVTPISGSVKIGGKPAFCPQESFLLSGTIKENILFGLEYDGAWFEEVLRLCELQHDISKLEDGAETLVGENGVKLSGGQKQRVCLARCVYSRPHVVLLDDPMSALDADVR